MPLRQFRTLAFTALLAIPAFSSADADGLELAQDGTITFEEVRETFDLLDAFDVEGFSALLTEDAEVVFGNSPALTGIPEIREGQKGFFAAIKGMSHNIDVDHVWSKKASFVVTGTVTYTRHDGSTLTIPFADVFELEGNKISRLVVHFDVTALFAQQN